MASKHTPKQHHVPQPANDPISKNGGATNKAENGRTEQLKTEINLRLEEYKALRAEIVASLTSSHLTTSLTITAAGVVIAGSPFIIQNHAGLLFLVASYCFFLIAWVQLHYVDVVSRISDHISIIIAPRIRSALREIEPSSLAAYENLLNWERPGRLTDLWALPLQSARFIFPIFAGGIALFGFLLNPPRLGIARWQPWVVPLGLGSGVILGLYSLYLTFKVGSRSRYYKPRDPTGN